MFRYRVANKTCGKRIAEKVLSHNKKIGDTPSTL